MITFRHNAWILGTLETTYIFRKTKTGHLEHLYYGPAIAQAESLSGDDLAAMSVRRVFPAGNMISYDADHSAVTLENVNLEMSSRGKGDIREPFLEIVNADGSRTSDFLFDSAEISESAPDLLTVPCSVPWQGDPEKAPDHLKIVLKDAAAKLKLELHYYVYEDCDVITRTARLINEGESSVTILRLMSAQLDLERADLQMTVFRGAWVREMARFSVPVSGPKVVNASACGTSSNRANPFVMLHPAQTSEDAGFAAACNLVYSGNHWESAEVNAFGQTRFLAGINPEGFSWQLRPQEAFEAPEAVLTCTDSGFHGISRHMHAFVRRHIQRGKWADEIRPILLNSWEACYFKINESTLLRLAKAAKDSGIELFVMDDGWFLNRNDDRHALGDWTVDRKKLPGGLSGLSDKIHGMGLKFGIWIEPEMVNVESNLYRTHPEWVMQIPGREHSEGRTQRVLDFANPVVVDYMTERMSRVFREGRVDYVKWDMNRIFSDVFSPYVASLDTDPIRQGETAHRYMIGVYRLAKNLTEAFPSVLFEGCASGGNRFDLGMLCCFPQIWGSDNTDAISRSYIQEGYSYGYPMSSFTSHISAVPNHQTLRVTSLATRFAVSAFGISGYELNLIDMPPYVRDAVTKQVELYKIWREVLQKGEFYRGRIPGADSVSVGQSGYPEGIDASGLYPGSGRIHEWTCVSRDRRYAVGLLLQEMVTPNSPFESYFPRGLDPNLRYKFTNLDKSHDIRKFGDLINTQAPVHVRQDSLLHRTIARFVKMPGEKENHVLLGSVLMKAGIRLSPAFAGTGYSDGVRKFQDYAARLYFMEAVDSPEGESDS
ncbi:MAG: alpha-galactosidase [Clostridiales bacterium]|nr:alpha-galactosidase [Clostridiales bacterium]